MLRRTYLVPEFEALDILESRLFLSGDHPSLADLPQATNIVMVDNLNTMTSYGRASGVIGTAGDDDLFMFTSPYTARAAVVVVQTAVQAAHHAHVRERFRTVGDPPQVRVDGIHGPQFLVDQLQSDIGQ